MGVDPRVNQFWARRSPAARYAEVLGLADRLRLGGNGTRRWASVESDEYRGCMRVIGLMSGTSADGVDAALVEWPDAGAAASVPAARVLLAMPLRAGAPGAHPRAGGGPTRRRGRAARAGGARRAARRALRGGGARRRARGRHRALGRRRDRLARADRRAPPGAAGDAPDRRSVADRGAHRRARPSPTSARAISRRAARARRWRRSSTGRRSRTRTNSASCSISAESRT